MQVQLRTAKSRPAGVGILLRRCFKMGVSLLVLSGVSHSLIAATYYRYINDEGVPVLDYRVPAEFTSRGYDIVNEKGRVIRVVPPALSDEEALARAKAQAKHQSLAKWDADLRLRYSSVKDIEAAKLRKLEQVQGRIAIIEGNVRNLKSQIAVQHGVAADSERLGKDVPKNVLQKIKNLEIELKQSLSQLSQREEQFQELEARYEADKQRFKIITEGQDQAAPSAP